MPGSAEASYYVWVDWFNTFGLGKNVPIVMGNLNSAIFALVDGKLVELHRAVSDGLLPEERRRPHRRCESRMEGHGAVVDLWHRAPCSIWKAERRTARAR